MTAPGAANGWRELSLGGAAGRTSASVSVGRGPAGLGAGRASRLGGAGGTAVQVSDSGPDPAQTLRRQQRRPASGGRRAGLGHGRATGRPGEREPRAHLRATRPGPDPDPTPARPTSLGPEETWEESWRPVAGAAGLGPGRPPRPRVTRQLQPRGQTCRRTRKSGLG